MPGIDDLIAQIWGEESPKPPRRDRLDELIAQVYGDPQSGPGSRQDAPGSPFSVPDATRTGVPPQPTVAGGPLPIGPYAQEVRPRAQQDAAALFAGASEVAPGEPFREPELTPASAGKMFTRGMGELGLMAAGGAAGLPNVLGDPDMDPSLPAGPEKLARAHQAVEPVSEQMEALRRRLGEPQNVTEDLLLNFPDVAVAGAVALPRAGLKGAARALGRGVHSIEPRPPARPTFDIEGMLARPEGFTFDPAKGAFLDEGGYMVGGVPGNKGRVIEGGLNEQDLRAFLDENAELLQQPGMRAGGWADQGKTYLDVSEEVGDEAEALKRAAERKELAVYHLTGKRSIDVPPEAPTPSKFTNRGALGDQPPARTAYRPVGDEEFEALADAQRGDPEEAMLALQRIDAAPLLGYVAEHVGDLTHRMSQKPSFFRGGGEWVADKVNKTLRTLKHPYGFQREVLEQVSRQAKAKGIPESELRGQMMQAGRAYAYAHRQLPAYNEAQRAARDAAVAIGEMRYRDAIRELESLKAILDQGDEAWSRAALENYTPRTAAKFTQAGALGAQPPRKPTPQGKLTPIIRVQTAGGTREFPGQVHALARVDAEEALGDLDNFVVEDGLFRDEVGNVFTRDEAYRHARKTGQLNSANIKSIDRMKRTKRLYAEGLKRQPVQEGVEWTGEVIPNEDILIQEIQKRFALREARAEKRLRKKHGPTNRRGALGETGDFDPQDFKDLVWVASAKMFRGLSGDDLAQEMVRVAGPGVLTRMGVIEEHARNVYSQMLQKATRGRKGFPTINELDQLFDEGKAGMGFYEGQSTGFRRVAGPEDGPMIGKLIAATSPATNATDGSNTRTALKAFKQIKKTGDIDRNTMMGAHYSMVKRLLQTGIVKAKDGLKTFSFSKNLSLPKDKDFAVTVDRWMARIFLGTEKVTNAQYVFIQEIVRDQAKKWGVAPREYQAALWHAIRTRTDPRYKVGEGDTYVDQLVRMIGEGYLDDLLEVVDQPYIAKVRKRTQGVVGNRRGNLGVDLAAGFVAGPVVGGAVGYGGAKVAGADEQEARTAGIVGAAGGTLLGPAATAVGAQVGRQAYGRLAARRAGKQIEPALQLAQKRMGAGVATGRADEYVNLSKFALDPTGEQVLREEVEKIGPAVIGDPKDVVTWAETRKIAREIGLADIARKDVNARLSGPEMLAIRNVVNRNVEQLKPLYARVAKGPDPEAEQMVAAIEQQNEALLSRFITNRARTGRDLNNLKILATRIDDPFFWRMKAENIARQGGTTLTGDQLRKIDILVQAGDPAALVKHIMDLRPTKVSDQLVSIWKAGLLTNPATHLANITGNTAMAGMEAVKDVPAALWDRILGFFTGETTKSANFVRSMVASASGATKGYREARNVARGLPSARALTKIEVPAQSNIDLPVLPRGANRFLDAYTKTIFAGRELPAGAFVPGLGAQDAFFKELAAARSLDEQARVLAGKDRLLLKSLRESPTDEMVLNAIVDAEYTTFTRQSKATEAIGNLRDAGGAFGHVVAPFTRTPTNIAGTVIDYSPLGFLGAAKHTIKLYRAANKGATGRELRDLQRMASNKFGRASVGLVPIWVGWKLAEQERATGARPGQRTDAQQADLEGRQENSVQLGDNWRSVARLSPLGNLIALGANAYNIWHNPELDPLERVGGAAASIGTTLMESPFLQGVDEISRMTRDPVGGLGDFAGNTVASTVPSVVRATARGMDPVLRETEPTSPMEYTPAGIAKHAAEAVGNRIQAGIPGASRGLPAKRDQFGREKTRTGGIGTQVFDFSRPRGDQRDNDPVIAELSRVGAVVSQLARAPGEPITDYMARQEAVGALMYEALAKKMFDRKYSALPPVEQKEELEKVVRSVRAQATRGR